MLTMNDIILEGHPTLRLVAEEVDFPIAEETKETAQEMLQFLINSQNPEIAEEYKLRAGVGIAAPQINISQRIIAVHIPDEEDPEKTYSKILFNPKIISHSIQQVSLAGGEGCLSVNREVPGYVPRHERVTLTYQDLTGQSHKEKLRGYPSIVIQHEIDHLNGVMFYDRIDPDNPLSLPDDIKILGEE